MVGILLFQKQFRLFLGEIILANAAEGAFKIFGKICKSSAGSNAVIRITEGLIIGPAADIAYILHIQKSPLKLIVGFPYDYYIPNSKKMKQLF